MGIRGRSKRNFRTVAGNSLASHPGMTLLLRLRREHQISRAPSSTAFERVRLCDEECTGVLENLLHKQPRYVLRSICCALDGDCWYNVLYYPRHQEDHRPSRAFILPKVPTSETKTSYICHRFMSSPQHSLRFINFSRSKPDWTPPSGISILSLASLASEHHSYRRTQIINYGFRRATGATPGTRALLRTSVHVHADVL